MYCSLGFLDASRQLLWYCVHSLRGPRVAHITMNKQTYRSHSHLAYNCRCDFSIQLLCGAVTGYKEVATITNIFIVHNNYCLAFNECIPQATNIDRYSCIRHISNCYSCPSIFLSCAPLPTLLKEKMESEIYQPLANMWFGIKCNNKVKY